MKSTLPCELEYRTIQAEQAVTLTREEALAIYRGAIQQLRIVCPLLGLPLPLTGKERRRRAGEQEYGT